jgi:ribosome biogenesis GTPase A
LKWLRDFWVIFEGAMETFREFAEQRLEYILRSASLLLMSVRLERARKKVDDLFEGLRDDFALMVLGEFSSGKSSFINALLKENILATSILPETSAITIVRYGGEKKAEIRYKDGRKYELVDESDAELVKRDAKDIDRVEISYPLNRLKGFLLVDTPGLNTIFRSHEATTREFLHRADVIIWLFDALKLGKLREKEYVEYGREYAGEMIGVVNKVDLVDQGDLELLREFLERHFQGVFSRTFYVSSIRRNGLRGKTEEEGKHERDCGLKDLEDFLVAEIIPARRMLKYKATLGSLKQILRETGMTLEKGEADFVDKKKILENVTEGLRSIEAYVKERIDYMISDRVKVFAQDRKKSCSAFLESELKVRQALRYMLKPSDMTECFRTHVLDEKVLTDFVDEISRRTEDILIYGWKGRIEEGDIRDNAKISVSFPSLRSELDAVVSEVYSRAAEKILPVIYAGIVTGLVWLTMGMFAFVALIPITLVILCFMLGQLYLAARGKGAVEEFLGFIDQYCKVMSERIKEAASSVNRKLFIKAQDEVISQILGYNLSHGEIEDRLVSIREGREEVEDLLYEAQKLEGEMAERSPAPA